MALACAAFVFAMAYSYFRFSPTEDAKWGIVKVPIFAWLFALVIYTMVQLLNVRGVQIFEDGFWIVKNLPYCEFLPSSIRGSFLENDISVALCSNLAVFFLCAALYIVCKSEGRARGVLAFFALNIFCWSLWAIFQKYAGFTRIFGMLYTDTVFFGTFFLTNGGGAFAAIGGSVAFAMCFLASGRLKLPKVLFWIIVGLTAELAAFYSDSRGAQIEAFLVCAAFAIILLYRIFFKSNLITVLCGVAILAVFIAAGAWGIGEFQRLYRADSKLEKETKVVKKELTSSFEGRKFLYDVSWELFKDNALFGVGANSYKYEIPNRILNLQDSKRNFASSPNEPHSSVLCWLCEYGILGSIFFLGAIVSWVIMLLRRRMTAARAMLLAGIAIFFLHSCFDTFLSIPSAYLVLGFVAIMALSPLRAANDMDML